WPKPPPPPACTPPPPASSQPRPGSDPSSTDHGDLAAQAQGLTPRVSVRRYEPSEDLLVDLFARLLLLGARGDEEGRIAVGFGEQQFEVRVADRRFSLHTWNLTPGVRSV